MNEFWIYVCVCGAVAAFFGIFFYFLGYENGYCQALADTYAGRPTEYVLKVQKDGTTKWVFAD